MSFCITLAFFILFRKYFLIELTPNHFFIMFKWLRFFSSLDSIDIDHELSAAGIRIPDIWVLSANATCYAATPPHLLASESYTYKKLTIEIATWLKNKLKLRRKLFFSKKERKKSLIHWKSYLSETLLSGVSDAAQVFSKSLFAKLVST